MKVVIFITKYLPEMKANTEEKEKILKLHKTFNDLKPKLINYIGRKLNLGIKNKIIEKGFYSIEGILDDIYLMSFDELEENPAAFNPKISLFKNTIDRLNEIMNKGKLFNQNIPVDKLLEQEIADLRENFTADADGDLIPEDELTDISYHLKDYDEKIFLTDDQSSKEINSDMEKYDRILLRNKRIDKMGSLTKTIVELAILGNLSSRDISEVLNVNIDDIEFVFKQLKI